MAEPNDIDNPPEFVERLARVGCAVAKRLLWSGMTNHEIGIAVTRAMLAEMTVEDLRAMISAREIIPVNIVSTGGWQQRNGTLWHGPDDTITIGDAEGGE